MTDNFDHYEAYRAASQRLYTLQANLHKALYAVDQAEAATQRAKAQAERIRMTMRNVTAVMNKHAEHIL